MFSARSALKAEYAKLHKAVLAIVRKDEVCRRLMTVPGVGPLVAITSNRRWTILSHCKVQGSRRAIRAHAKEIPVGGK